MSPITERARQRPRHLQAARRLLLCLLFAGAAGGCDRSHMSPRYGHSLRWAFARQVIDPHAADRWRGAEGLDPQEAAIIADGYRRSLSPRGDAEAARRVPVLQLPAPVPVAAPAHP